MALLRGEALWGDWKAGRVPLEVGYWRHAAEQPAGAATAHPACRLCMDAAERGRSKNDSPPAALMAPSSAAGTPQLAGPPPTERP